ncbi:carbohydrate-binding family 9-like protein [Opitutales bacterium]|jgi:hypothetical protein|nr:carbohydrate-binding family 9-like protein [Opitutales bacterium]
MKRCAFLGLCFVSVLMLTACQESVKDPVYKSVSLLGITMNVDGQLDEKIWETAYWERDFTFPWQTMKTPATAFCSASDREYLYFAFKVQDTDIVYASGPDTDEKGVAKGDRVEIFFSKDESLEDYYCLEMSPKGRVMDYRASHYREFDHSWTCEGLQLAGQVVEDGYVVEGAIPFNTLIELGLGKPGQKNRILTGLYRGEFSHGAGYTIIQRWISWITPDAETPDFHIPSSFGHLEVSVGAK